MFLAALVDSMRDKIPMMSDYVNDILTVTPQMIALGGRVAAAEMMRVDLVVSSIVNVGREGGWEVDELSMEYNDYIDSALDRAAQVWEELAGRNCFLDDRLLETAWRGIVGAVYEGLLEGFGKVQTCSTEGRALMSMDLQYFSESVASNNLVDRYANLKRDCAPTGLNAQRKDEESSHKRNVDFHNDGQLEDASQSNYGPLGYTPYEDEFILREPPSVSPPKGKHWVDAYIKAWYYGHEDLVKWISQNKSNYRLTQCVTLVMSGAGRNVKKRDLRNAILAVEALFRE